MVERRSSCHGAEDAGRRARASTRSRSSAADERTVGELLFIASSTTSPIRTSTSSTPSTREIDALEDADRRAGRRPQFGCGSQSCATSFSTAADRRRRRAASVRRVIDGRRRRRRRRAVPARGRAALRGHLRHARSASRRSSTSPATCSPGVRDHLPVEDRREPERGRQEAHRHRVARPRPLVHRRLLRTELRGGLRSRVLGAGSLGRAHRRVDARSSSPSSAGVAGSELRRRPRSTRPADRGRDDQRGCRCKEELQ